MFRLNRKDKLNIILEEFAPAQEKKDGTFTQAYWRNIAYCGNKWESAIRIILSRNICPVGDSLLIQLEDMPDAIDRAVQKIIEGVYVLVEEHEEKNEIYIMLGSD